MTYPEKFTGFQVKSADTWQEVHKLEFDPKPFDDYDVDVKIECCGVCASDIHTIRGDWGPKPYPLAVGHGKTCILFVIYICTPSADYLAKKSSAG